MEVCVELATCEDVEGTAVCNCQEGTEGDGFVGLDHTGCRYRDCPSGMTLLVETLTCIGIVPNATNSKDAKTKCNNMFGAELATLANPAAVNLTKHQAAQNSYYGDYYIGLSDAIFEGHYQWPDNTVTDYTQWDTGAEEQNSQDKDCVTIQLGTTFKYSPQPCDYDAQGFLCSKSVLNELHCPQGWIKDDGECYFTSSEPGTYMEAYMKCSLSGADLVSFHSADQEDHLTDLLNMRWGDFWIGLQDGFTTITDNVFDWTDTTPLDYRNYQTLVGEAPEPRCVYRPAEGHWVASKCDAKMNYVCMKKAGVDRKCPIGSIRFGEHCYKPKDERLPYYDGHQYCLSMGGDILSIASPGEMSLLILYLTSQGLVQDYWTGLRETSSGVFEWTDRTPYAYTNWENNNFDSSDKMTCTRLLSNSEFMWEDDPNCEQELPFICKFKNTRCKLDSECNENGHCYKGQCRCKSGYQGDGLNVCRDVNECLDDPCHIYATCTNTVGSYKCNCNPGYAGNGEDCINVNACNVDMDCNTNAKCNDTGVCECNAGYEGDGKSKCDDIDECGGENECSDNAECFNTDGSYDCECRDGFFGDGKVCESTPQSCHHILQADPSKAISGQLYYIDPDGTGGLDQFKVRCVFKDGIGITLIQHWRQVKTAIVRADPNSSKVKIDYKHGATEAQIKGLVAISFYCYQPVQYWCGDAINIYQNNQWVSPRGVRQTNWGGAPEQDQCLCGVLGSCKNAESSCNCDGKTAGATDMGLITNKEELPIREFYFGGTSRGGAAHYQVGEMKCAPKYTGLPKHCEEGKQKYGWTESGEYFIDVDGMDGDDEGNLDPFLVHCNMDDYPNTAVTELPHDNGRNDGTNPNGPQTTAPPGTTGPPGTEPSGTGPPGTGPPGTGPPGTGPPGTGPPGTGPPGTGPPGTGPPGTGPPGTGPPGTGPPTTGPPGTTTPGTSPHPLPEGPDGPFGPQKPTQPGTYPILYPVLISKILKLITVSAWCSQTITYTCQNSRLLSGGAMYTYWSDARGNPKDYWGYRNKTNHCDCGVIGTCPGENLCNCDANDGEERMDFGLLTNKGDLPVGAITMKDIGEGRVGKYNVGWLRCGEEQFGIPPSCEKYAKEYEMTETNAYVIDPDGAVERDASQQEAADNVSPFLVECVFTEQGQGITIVYPDPDKRNKTITDDQPIDIDYPNVDDDQMKKLIDRSVTCTQKITYGCKDAPIHRGGANIAYWNSPDGTQRNYFEGDSGDSCACSVAGDCTGGGKCNCDAEDGTLKKDSGTLINKDHLPITTFRAGDFTDSTIELGPLICGELYKTCYDIDQRYKLVNGETELENGVYLIDPGVTKAGPPFQVYCLFPIRTILTVKGDGDETLTTDSTPGLDKPHAVCQNVSYGAVTTEQLTALAEESGWCQQYGKYRCKNAPLSTHGAWIDRLGNKQPGWAGNNAGDECACGEVDKCQGGVDAGCDCDVTDGKEYYDHGDWIDKSTLPVSGVCMGVKEGETGSAGYKVSDLTCTPWQVNVFKDCQDRRNHGHTRSEAWIIDPDGRDGAESKPFTAWCEMTTVPPMGVTVITLNTTGCANLPTTAHDQQFFYNQADDLNIRKLTDTSTYCTQDISYTCTNSDLKIDANHGWYSLEDQMAAYWGGNTGGTGCSGGQCACATQDGQEHTDGGILLDGDVLPVAGVKVAAAGADGKRCLDVKEFKCYTIYRHCHDILINNAKYDPNRNDHYAIDPDQAGGVDPFDVYCDWGLDSYQGVTVVVSNTGGVVSWSEADPAQYNLEWEYGDVTIEQIRELIAKSGWCSQKLEYECTRALLINDNKPAYAYFFDYNNTAHYVWAGYDRDPTKVGCACQLFDTCPEGHTCRCDAQEATQDYEGGIVTNLDILPLTKFQYGGVDASGRGYIKYDSPKCAPKAFDLPKSCEDARKKGRYSKEQWIWPNPKQNPDTYSPTFVTCDYDILPGKAVTVLHLTEKKITLGGNKPFPSIVEMTYDQAKAFAIWGAKKCYLPMKLTSYHTKLSEKCWWKNRGYYVLRSWGHAASNSGLCSCGADKKCGGDDGKDAMKARKCNADVNDDKMRVDAGIMEVRPHVPLTRMICEIQGDSTVTLELGDIYCFDSAFDLDECKLGWHDCHENATCINQNQKFACQCKEGWQAIGRPELWANGRECYDDDECAMDICPITANCENTPGSFICHCKDGFRKTGPTTCEDINECEENSHECDKNAGCYNTMGSYLCMCKDGFRGDGRNCTEFGTCMCFGDPHCVSFDRKWSHFQGACTYTLVQDNCAEGYPLGDPTFQVLQKTWRDYIPTHAMVSWVKEVHILAYGFDITLKQQRVVFKDDRRILRLPAYPIPGHPEFVIKLTGPYVHVITDFGVEVKWTGSTKVEVGVSGTKRGSVCGICGNYDDDPVNDFVVGPSCPDHNPSSVTENENLYGHSWTHRTYPDDDEKCEVDCGQPPGGPCAESAMEDAAKICQSLQDPQGSFADCFKVLPAGELENRLVSCKFDLCMVEPSSRMPMYCTHADDLTQRCSDLGNPVETWRSESLCQMECTGGKVYKACGNACMPTCIEPNGPTECLTQCQEGCYCEAGMVLDGDKCIKPEQCGCEVVENVDGGDITNYYSGGDRIVRKNCSEECTCNPQSRFLECKAYECGAHATCGLEDGIEECYCDKGYENGGANGKDCEDDNECAEETDDCHKNGLCTNTDGSFNCTCREGYAGDGRECEDVNECQEDKDNCDEITTDCRNTDGGFECICAEGYINNSGTKCEDKDECKSTGNICDRASTNCENNPGSYECVCKTGFEPLDFTNDRCNDIDECKKGIDNCHDNATCNNSPGSFSCTCKPGFTGNGTECKDIDECKLDSANDCDDNAQCTNNVGSYTCTCNEGYSGDGKNCDEIDECTDTPQDTNCVFEAGNGHCNNTPGSYVCGCNPGFTGDGTTDGDGCKDIDECKRPGAPICGSNSVCTNNPPGSYTCKCEDRHFSPTNNDKNCQPVPTCDDDVEDCGNNTVCIDTFTQQGPHCECQTGYESTQDPIKECTDIDECKENSLNDCDGANMVCENKAGGYECGCEEGYRLTEDGQCEDINECEEGSDTCDDVSEDCQNQAGSFSCSCKDGFTVKLNGDGTKTCEDNNECTEDNECDENADCNNTPGSYTCTCKEGYVGSGINCEDAPECSDPEGNRCSDDAECVERTGGYDCNCLEGYEGDGETCDDIDECERGLHNCANGAKCFNTEGAFFCGCLDGYSGHCDACEDDDECGTGMHNCHHNADCTNTPGSFTCKCKTGYDGDGVDCKDIDECTLGMDNCRLNNAGCTNTFGSFVCTCALGFQMVEGKCEDVDECKTGALCDRNAKCLNNFGSYECECKEGYFGDGIHCVIDDPKVCDNNTRCDTFADCVDNGQGREERVCRCRPGYAGSGVVGPNGESGCSGLDPCRNSSCDDNAKCYNVLGLPKCVCNSGYRGSGLVCTEEDPCEPTPCQRDLATCVKNDNSAKGYDCVCEEGYTNEQEHTCVDVDECADSEETNGTLCQDGADCLNTPGSYVCKCRYGFEEKVVLTENATSNETDITRTCVDVDECTLERDDCSENAICENTPGSYSCTCKEGYEGDGRICKETSEEGCTLECGENQWCDLIQQDPGQKCQCVTGFEAGAAADGSLTCTDVDECARPANETICHDKADCVNKKPGFSCICKDGYQGNGIYCEDIDECAENHGCADQAECKNTPGSYDCHCKRGYTGDGKTCQPIDPVEDPCECGPYGVCEPETFLCYCKPGFKPDYTNTTQVCQDEDSCQDPKACHPAAVCTDSFGGYYCDCPEGMTGDGRNYCDTDECALGTDMCHQHATCTNTEGWYSCECKEGFSGNGIKCDKDMAPCEDVNLQCGENTICIVDGTVPRCQCEYGFEGDGDECTDVNECDPSTPNPCADVAFCRNHVGGYTCTCPNGYRGSGVHCEDINECKENSNDCDDNADCQNQIGSYKCFCKEGYSGDGKECVEGGNCREDDNCHEKAKCTLLASGAFQCVCETGYEGDGLFCKDTDECADGTNYCHANATCTNKPGFFDCACKDGFDGDGFYCRDIDECDSPADNDCKEGQKCSNLLGGYTCSCEAGYKEENGACVDLDECSQDEWNLCHKNATCTNSPGSYKCKCADGFIGDAVTKCDDVDECELGIANCEENTMCYNTPGSFLCGCLRGFVTGEDGCEDVDECDEEKNGDNRCGENSNCTNTPGSYNCACKEGFQGDGVICIDPNPCDNAGVCAENAACRVIDGKADCQCRLGFRGEGVQVCQPIDECNDGTDECDENADCINKNDGDGYECRCKTGFHGDGKNCTDNNECDPSTPQGGGNECDASQGEACENSPPGSYTCVCTPGYGDSGDECKDENECDTGNNDCDENAECDNKAGGYVCNCKEGFEGDGKNCTDIDECDIRTDTCEFGETCENTEGGFACPCAKGFRFDEDDGKCHDIDECKEQPGACDKDAVCTNIDGTFICTCKEGFEGDGQNCTDINECESIEDPCHKYAECSNIPGACICTCENGYVGDGIFCTEEDKCPDTEEENTCPNKTYCAGSNNPDYPGKQMCDCRNGYKPSGQYDCTGDKCVEQCSAVNECELQDSVCDKNAECTDLPNGYSCKCKEGYSGNGLYCRDVDECAKVDDDCDPVHGKCTNTDGSYECACQEGFVGSGITCLDENECATGSNDCDEEGECINLVGGYTCKCKEGYRGNGRNCTEIDECAEDRDTCHPMANCTNTPGSFKCACPEGYAGDGEDCNDIDECPNGCPDENARCLNKPGSFECRCVEGFRPNDKGECEDIDECEEATDDCPEGACENTPGTFICKCPEGQVLVGDKCEDENECIPVQGDGSGVCGAGGTCSDGVGGCLCGCPPKQSPPQGTTCGPCTDTDECTDERYPHDCPDTATCENQIPGFKCVCKEGYTGDGRDCKDVDECKEEPNPCGNGKCTNTEGAFICDCEEGFLFEEGNCTDINECLMPDPSTYADECKNAECENTEPGYKCNCKEGYKKKAGSETECEDIDECKETPGVCGGNSTCKNTDGSYKCDCQQGTLWDHKDKACVDIDECAETDGRICGDPSVSNCDNKVGGYECSCKEGFEVVNGRCTNINECQERDDMCGADIECIDIEGGYVCNCKEGYKKDGNKCLDIDECEEEEGKQPCDRNAICVNTPGSFVCKCMQGFTGDGLACTAICGDDACPPMQSCSVDNYNLPVCTCQCEGQQCLDVGKVCGTDGQTYSSDRAMFLSACQRGVPVDRNYKGECQSDCGNVTCARKKTCEMRDGKPVCVCPEDCPETKPEDAVCSTRGITYYNKCHFEYLSCATDSEDEIAYDGECTEPVDCKYTQWTAWSPCGITCGNATRTRRREIVEEAAFGGAECAETTQKKVCIKAPCPGSPCETKICQKYSKCLMQGSQPKCVCESCVGEPYDPVCGVLHAEVGEETVHNLCWLKHSACLNNADFTFLHPGSCTKGPPVEPIKCTMVMEKQYVEEDGWKSRDQILVNRCGGGCESLKFCCRPTQTTYERHPFVPDGPNPKGLQRMVMVAITKECSCLPVEEVKAQEGIVETVLENSNVVIE